MATQLNLKIISRENTIYAGQVLSISSFNKVGFFDILQEHSNFITLINKKLVIKELDGKVREYAIENGLLRVINNSVEIFLGLENENSYE